MKSFKSSISVTKKVTALALTGAIALPMLTASPAAQADPPKNAPAWGYRDNHNKPGNNDGNRPGRDNNRPNNDRDQNSYDRNGFDRNGRDHDGRDRDGRDRDGRDRNGFDRGGFDRNGYNRDGYNRNGFNRGGFDRFGYDRNGRDRNGHDRNWRPSPNYGGSGNWGNGNNNGYGVNTTVTGTVIDSLNQRDTLRVRADNGRIYTIPTGTAHYYRVNNRVRISGRLNGSTFVNASVSRL